MSILDATITRRFLLSATTHYAEHTSYSYTNLLVEFSEIFDVWGNAATEV